MFEPKFMDLKERLNNLYDFIMNYIHHDLKDYQGIVNNENDYKTYLKNLYSRLTTNNIKVAFSSEGRKIVKDFFNEKGITLEEFISTKGNFDQVIDLFTSKMYNHKSKEEEPQDIVENLVVLALNKQLESIKKEINDMKTNSNSFVPSKYKELNKKLKHVENMIARYKNGTVDQQEIEEVIGKSIENINNADIEDNPVENNSTEVNEELEALKAEKKNLEKLVADLSQKNSELASKNLEDELEKNRELVKKLLEEKDKTKSLENKISDLETEKAKIMVESEKNSQKNDTLEEKLNQTQSYKNKLDKISVMIFIILKTLAVDEVIDMPTIYSKLGILGDGVSVPDIIKIVNSYSLIFPGIQPVYENCKFIGYTKKYYDGDIYDYYLQIGMNEFETNIANIKDGYINLFHFCDVHINPYETPDKVKDNIKYFTDPIYNTISEKGYTYIQGGDFIGRFNETKYDISKLDLSARNRLYDALVLEAKNISQSGLPVNILLGNHEANIRMQGINPVEVLSKNIGDKSKIIGVNSALINIGATEDIRIIHNLTPNQRIEFDSSNKFATNACFANITSGINEDGVAYTQAEHYHYPFTSSECTIVPSRNPVLFTYHVEDGVIKELIIRPQTLKGNSYVDAGMPIYYDLNQSRVDREFKSLFNK